MRLLHISDLHLGKSLGDFNMADDQKHILDQILDIITDRSIDAVLIAGDVYDRSLPSETAVNLLDGFLSSLADKEIRVFMISGNHDSEERLGYGSRLFKDRGIHVATDFEGLLSKAVIEDEHGRINVYMLPFVKASQVKHFYPEEKIENYEDAVRTVIAHSKVDFEERNVLIAHQFVSGTAETKIAGSEGAAVQNVGMIEVISSEVFKGFDYVALGHIHSPQSIGEEHIRYAGSPLKYSLSEADNEKSLPLAEIGEKGSVRIELLPLRPRRDLRHIRGRLDQLLQAEKISDPDDYMYVTLTDEDIIDNAMGIVRQYYPNTIKIDYQNSHTREIDSFDIGEIGDRKPFREIISDFYLKMYGTEMGDDELSVMMSVAEEAGVVNEAD